MTVATLMQNTLEAAEAADAASASRHDRIAV
jgi:5,10-methylene-tetrahydrofolate dehydrogenase/methenyl tetrahydrofolate cyclohydrolase